MRFSPPLQVLERGPGGEVSESPEIIQAREKGHHRYAPLTIQNKILTTNAQARRWCCRHAQSPKRESSLFCRYSGHGTTSYRHFAACAR